jgi:hypothetical protein
LAAASSPTSEAAIVRLPCIFQLPATSFLRMRSFHFRSNRKLSEPL